MTAKRNQFLLISPRRQVVTKTDLAKVECCFNLEPDVACKGAEKAFVAFAERVSKEWSDESRRAIYGDEWFRSAVARVILFRAAEASVSKATWYEGGYRAQIVAYTCARLAKLAFDQEGSGGLDYVKVWGQQSAGAVLEQQVAEISEVMSGILRNPPSAGQNITEWAKQQSCRKTALETEVPIVKKFDDWIVTMDYKRASKREQRATGLIDRGLESVKQVLSRDSKYWESLCGFCRTKHILQPEDEKALVPACQIPNMVPTDRQAARLIQLIERAESVSWQISS